MQKEHEFTTDFVLKLYSGEGVPVTIRHIYKWLGGTITEFAIGDEVSNRAPSWICGMDEEKMQRCTILEVVNAPKHLKGEWKQVFDEHKNVIVKYFPTEEEKARKRMIDKASKKTLLMGAVVSSLGGGR